MYYIDKEKEYGYEAKAITCTLADVVQALQHVRRNLQNQWHVHDIV